MRELNKRIALTLIFDTNGDEKELDNFLAASSEVLFNDFRDENTNLDPLACMYQPEGSHWREIQPPYPWCHGHPTRLDCIEIGYCRRSPSCGD